MRRLYGLLALVVLIASCGSSDAKAVKAESESSTTDATVTTTTAAAGATGPTGPTGSAGAPGPPGVSGYQIVETSQSVRVTQNALGSFSLAATCPPGKSVMGGGASTTIDPPYFNGVPYRYAYITQSEPGDASTWTATAGYNGLNAGEPQTLTLRVKAVCATVST